MERLCTVFGKTRHKYALTPSDKIAWHHVHLPVQQCGRLHSTPWTFKRTWLSNNCLLFSNAHGYISDNPSFASTFILALACRFLHVFNAGWHCPVLHASSLSPPLIAITSFDQPPCSLVIPFSFDRSLDSA